jgi:hypothetical protein
MTELHEQLEVVIQAYFEANGKEPDFAVVGKLEWSRLQGEHIKLIAYRYGSIDVHLDPTQESFVGVGRKVVFG